MSREQKLLQTWKQKCKSYYENITLEMNKFTEGECLPNFELKFEFLENLTKPLALKSTKKRIEEKNKMAETREESQTTVRAEENQTSHAKENQTGINAEKSQASTPENQTIVAYTDDELASFRDNMVSKNTKKSTSTSVRRLQSWFKEKHGKQMYPMQFRSKKHRSFSNTSS